MRRILTTILSSCPLLFSMNAMAVPPVSGEPVVVQHLGKLEWPQDDAVTTPYLTQFAANDINDLHGDVSCDLIISTSGNYHMAMRDAMKGRADLGFDGLQAQLKADYDVTVCWSTSPPISPEQALAGDLQYKNIHVKGVPALAMGPKGIMNKLLAQGSITAYEPFLRNQGNVILARADKARKIKDVCDLGGKTRVVTPHPDLEPGSFGNFSGTIFNVADQNDFGCDATELFDSIFGQDVSEFDLSKFDNPYDIPGVLSVFTGTKGYRDGEHRRARKDTPKWVASSRIMHRDIPYALCHNEADAGVIFYHLAKYMKRELAASGCELEIIPMGGTEANLQPLPGNRVGTLNIAKVNADFPQKVLDAREVVYSFLTASPVWTQIMADHGIVDPTP